jgi:glucose-1-phosphate thymidylyltransferase
VRGIILAGGAGTRLYPVTRSVSKQLLPVYDKPMIYYPLEAMVSAGITEVLVVTGGSSAGDFMRLLGDGLEFGLTGLYFAYQRGASGIADALRLAQGFCAGHKFCVILGDNIMEKSLKPYADRFRKGDFAAMILFNRVKDNQRFGVPYFDGDTLLGIEEKPEKPKSEYAVTGIYFYDHQVFDFINSLTPSARGEYEITDVNNAYLATGKLAWEVLEGWWSDAGTFESIRHASNLVAESGANNPWD